MPFANDLIDSNRERLDEQGVARLQSRFLFEPAAVMALLRSRIVGQDAVLAQVEAKLTEAYETNLITEAKLG